MHSLCVAKPATVIVVVVVVALLSSMTGSNKEGRGGGDKCRHQGGMKAHGRIERKS